jgi:AcrR family transcriptional regulator
MVKKRQSGAEDREPLSREAVLQAAMEIMDDNGIERLSMRLLGAKLGVEAMSLYNHVANKDDIIDGALEAVVSEITIPVPGNEWRSAMQARAGSARAAFKRHPWACALLDSRLSSHPARLHYFDSMIETLHRAGFPLELAARAFSVMDSYIYGFLRQQNHLSAGDEASRHDQARNFRDMLPEPSYPYLARMAEWVMTHGYDEEADFEFGLNLILDGLQKILRDNADRDPGS